MSHKNLKFTEKLYGDGQFKFSIEKIMLPDGFIRYHKGNFQKYFGLTEDGFNGKRTLDTGCGPGKHSAVLALMGAKVLGVDLAAENIVRCEKIKAAHGLDNLKFQRHNLMYPLKMKEFELISAHNWIQHAEDPSVVLYNLVHSLSMGGRLYLSLYHGNTFRFFVAAIARRLLKRCHYDFMRNIVRYFFPLGFKGFNNPVDIYMENIFDDFFVPYCHTTTYDVIIRDTEKLGLRHITDVPMINKIQGMDNVPLRIGLEKVGRTPETIELEYKYPINEFESNNVDVQESIPLVRDVIQRLSENDNVVDTCCFCLGLYWLRAEINKWEDVKSRHRSLRFYLESTLDGSLSSLSYYDDCEALYTKNGVYPDL